MKRKLTNGMVQVYTGNGKGKTTASFGLAVRASGAGLKVCIYQFIKNGSSSEIDVLKKIPNITIKQLGRGRFIKGPPRAKDFELAEKGIALVAKEMSNDMYDLVILDEANVAMKLGLIGEQKMLDIISNKPKNTEIVLTGRDCPPGIMKCADLITEMKDIKHPFSRGIKCRLGIER